MEHEPDLIGPLADAVHPPEHSAAAKRYALYTYDELKSQELRLSDGRELQYVQGLVTQIHIWRCAVKSTLRERHGS